MKMKAKQYLEQSMQEEQIREALNAHWHASAAGDANAEHDIHDRRLNFFYFDDGAVGSYGGDTRNPSPSGTIQMPAECPRSHSPF
jgi:hypothetical protein